MTRFHAAGKFYASHENMESLSQTIDDRYGDVTYGQTSVMKISGVAEALPALQVAGGAIECFRARRQRSDGNRDAHLCICTNVLTMISRPDVISDDSANGYG
jgi:hypothetical protein